jgi:hypothetical protein
MEIKDIASSLNLTPEQEKEIISKVRALGDDVHKPSAKSMLKALITILRGGLENDGIRNLLPHSVVIAAEELKLAILKTDPKRFAVAPETQAKIDEIENTLKGIITGQGAKPTDNFKFEW